MLLLVDENITATVIAELRRLGHDVLSVKESMRSEADDVILARAQVDRRIVVARDKDFGEQAFRSNLPAASGVILFRLNGPGPAVENQRVLRTIASRTDWAGHSSVVTNDRIRMRPFGLPSSLDRAH